MASNAKLPARAIPKLPDGAHYQAGRYDNAGRWYPSEDYDVPGSFQVRSPSRNWPYSYVKHFYTRGYSRLLLVHAPELWAELMGLEADSLRVLALVALAREEEVSE